jgi:hypothetical protein
MAGPPVRSPRGTRRVLFGGLSLAGGWAFLLEANRPLNRLFGLLHQWWGSTDMPGAAEGRLHRFVDLVGHAFPPAFLAGTVASAVALASLLLPLGMLVRMAARARVRAGLTDPLDRLRGWVAGHRSAVRWLGIVSAASWTALAAEGPFRTWFFFGDPREQGLIVGAYGVVAMVSLVASALLLRLGTRVFLSPTVDDAEAAPGAELTSDEITFDAVAVTRETIAAVVAMATLPFWPLLLLVTSYHPSDVVVRSGMLAQALIAFAGVAHFRCKSKIAVGVDGVYLSGSGRTRFFAYRDLDGAQVSRGGDLLLVRGKRTALRLQLHGQDALKRDAILARIGEAIARVKDGRSAIAAQLVSTASPERLANAASGGGDYRGAALTREQLWALVEGPEVDESARRMAAEALARTGDDSERARLRVAAEHCAAPRVRVALLELAELAELADAPVVEDRPARPLAT